MNISAPFLVQVPIFKSRIEETLPYMDYLFGNESEFAALSESMGWSVRIDLDSSDVASFLLSLVLAPQHTPHLTCPNFQERAISEIVQKVGRIEKKNSQRPRIVVCTQGKDATIVYNSETKQVR